MSADALILLAVVAIAIIIIRIWPGGERKQSSQAAPRETLSKVKVQHVIDGDTVIVSKSRRDLRIRLDSIDCPENGQHWGDTAKAGLIKLIGGRYVLIEEHDVDRHGRTLATIYSQHGHRSEWINVNERMVMLGHAWVMRKYYDHLPKRRQHQLNGLEQWAKSKRVGLWKTSNPIPPWRWRSQR